MKVLVTGSKGQLGYDVIKELCSRGHEALGFDLPELDITDEVAVRAVFDRVKPDAVIHCAAANQGAESSLTRFLPSGPEVSMISAPGTPPRPPKAPYSATGLSFGDSSMKR